MDTYLLFVRAVEAIPLWQWLLPTLLLSRVTMFLALVTGQWWWALGSFAWLVGVRAVKDSFND